MYDLYNKYREIIRYLVFGVLTTVVSLVVYYASVCTFLNPDNSIELQVANILSWVISVGFAYITNRLYVFQSQASSIVLEGLSFYGSRLGTLLCDMGLMFLLVTVLQWDDKLAKLLVQVVVIVANYVLSKWLVFK